MAPPFLQYPPCDYPLNEFKIWEYSPSPAPAIPSKVDPYQIVINSNDMSKARMQTLTLRNSITYQSQVFNPFITFEIELLHPCRRTTFNEITIPAISYQLRSGQNQDLTQIIPTDAASAAYGDGWNVCGPRTYAITNDKGVTPSWVTVVTVGAINNNFIIRVAIDDETYVGTSPHTMTLLVGFANYPKSADPLHPTRTFTFTITVVKAVCDCILITWKEPENLPHIVKAMVVTTPAKQDLDEAGPLQSSLTATSGARACDHQHDECDYAYTIQAMMHDQTPLPNWLVY